MIMQRSKQYRIDILTTFVFIVENKFIHEKRPITQIVRSGVTKERN